MSLPFTMFVLSDLHLEFCKTSIDKYVNRIPETDVLVLAGDIGMPNKQHFSRFLQLCSERHDMVIFVPGNHEYWSEKTDKQMDELCDKCGVIMLQNEMLSYLGIIFIGSTLWTNLLTVNTEMSVPIPTNDLNNMNDFVYIPGLNRQTWKQKHNLALDFITTTLNEYKKSKCIVITHHGPSIECIPPEYNGDILNGCYVSHLDYIFNKPQLHTWIFGHTHKSMCKKVGIKKNTLLFANSGRSPGAYKFKLWFKEQDNIWNAEIDEITEYAR
jgi:predicted phosphohydrolase